MNKHYELYIEKMEEFKKKFKVSEGNLCCDMYECDEKHFKTDEVKMLNFIRQTFIDIADREIERLEEKKMEKDYSVEAQDIDWSKHDIHNKALNQQISYWNKAKKLITNHE